MSGDPFAVVLLGLALAGGWSLARSAIPAADSLALGVTSLALSVGLLTLAMLWVALLMPGRLVPGSAAAAIVAVLAGAAVALRRRPRPTERFAPGGGRVVKGPMRAVVLVVPAVCAAILLGAVLWPFRAGDALAVYGPLGRAIVATGELPVGERLYEAYPQLVPMLFAAVEWAVGRPDEYLSRLACAILAVGAVAGAGWLARELRSVRAAWLAAALLTACPVFCGWATMGYADIPAGFFVVVSAVFAWRWWRDRNLADAVLGGAAAGLALWTKNSAITLLVSGPVLTVGWWWADRHRRLRCPPEAAGGAAVAPWSWRHVAAAAATASAVAAPFYIRNLVVFGFAVPATAWTDRARRDLAGLLDPLQPERGFGLLGWAAAVVTLLCLVRLLVRRGAAAREVLLAAIVVPFVGAWWWWASYDPRFLVTVLPVVAGFAGALLDEGLEKVERAGRRPARWASVIAVVTVLLATPAALRRTVENKRALLADPLMNGVERHRLQVGGLFELGREIGRLPAGARIAGVPPMARYYLEHDRLPLVAWASPTDAPCAAGFDYRVLVAPGKADTARPVCAGPVVFRTTDGYELVQVLPAHAAIDEENDT